MTFELTSNVFKEGSAIPARYTCDGEDISPPLAWRDVPPGTESFALIVDDPDARLGVFTHWVLFNLPADISELPENIPHADHLPQHAGIQGRNDFGKIGYGGPCPPHGGAHRYRFSLYALDTTLNAKPATTRQHLDDLMNGHALGLARVTGTYHRRDRR